MKGHIAVVNAGSSSVKFSIFDINDGDPRFIYKGKVTGIGAAQGHFLAQDARLKRIEDRVVSSSAERLTHQQAFSMLQQWVSERHEPGDIVAVGHRVVHGGADYTTPVVVDESALDTLEKLCPLAPLHQPHNLNAIRAVQDINPDLLQVACFDTAFHYTQSENEQLFALPHALRNKGIRRYGFHGLSYEYIASVLPDYVGDEADKRVIVAHLGNGASMCAMRKRESVATTMGFTALDGLPMGTRSGALDPGVVLYLIGELGMTSDQVTELLYRKSGMLGLSGMTNDMRRLLVSDEANAKRAVDFFIHRIKREIGALTAVLGGLDALVFTAGIGENAAPVRQGVCDGLRYLGIEIDHKANDAGRSKISTEASTVSVCVIPTYEGLMIARHTYQLLLRNQAMAAPRD